MSHTKKRVLFLCTGNSARSQMAEGLVNHLLGDTWEARSAGTAPAGFVHPLAIRALEELGIDISDHRSKPLSEFRMADFDVAITLCDDACAACSVSLGRTKKIHIGFPDPAQAEGSEEQRLEAFRQVRNDIQKRVFRYLTENNHHTEAR